MRHQLRPIYEKGNKTISADSVTISFQLFHELHGTTGGKRLRHRSTNRLIKKVFIPSVQVGQHRFWSDTSVTQ